MSGWDGGSDSGWDDAGESDKDKDGGWDDGWGDGEDVAVDPVEEEPGEAAAAVADPPASTSISADPETLEPTAAVAQGMTSWSDDDAAAAEAVKEYDNGWDGAREPDGWSDAEDDTDSVSSRTEEEQQEPPKPSIAQSDVTEVKTEPRTDGKQIATGAAVDEASNEYVASANLDTEKVEAEPAVAAAVEISQAKATPDNVTKQTANATRPLSNRSNFRRDALEKLFRQIDANGDGTLSKREIIRAFALDRSLQDKIAAIPGLGDSLKPSQLRAAVKDMDVDKNNSVSLDEWVDYIEDCVDTTLLMSAFETAVIATRVKASLQPGKSAKAGTGLDETGNAQHLVSLDVLLEHFDHTIVGASSLDNLRKQITRRAGVMSGDLSILISQDDWLDVAFSIMNREDDEEEQDQREDELVQEELVDEKPGGNVSNEAIQEGSAKIERPRKQKKEEDEEEDVADLGSDLPPALATAAQSAPTTQLVLDAMKKQLSLEVYTTATALNKDTCGKTEREMLLDGVLRRHSPQALITTAKEAEGLRIMVDAAIGASNVQNGQGDLMQEMLQQFKLGLSAESRHRSDSELEPNHRRENCSNSSPCNHRTREGAQVSGSGDQERTVVQNNMSPTSCRRRRGLDLVFLLAEPASQHHSKMFGLGRRQRLANHVSARCKLTLVDAQTALRAYVGDSAVKRSRNGDRNRLQYLLETASSVEPTVDGDGYLKKDSMVVSSMLKAVTDAVAADESRRGKKSPSALPSSPQRPRGFHTHSFLVTGGFPSCPQHLHRFLAGVDTMCASVMWRVVYLKAPEPGRRRILLPLPPALPQTSMLREPVPFGANSPHANAPCSCSILLRTPPRGAWNSDSTAERAREETTRQYQNAFRENTSRVIALAASQPPQEVRVSRIFELDNECLTKSSSERIARQRKIQRRDWVLRLELDATAHDLCSLGSIICTFVREGSSRVEPNHYQQQQSKHPHLWIVDSSMRLERGTQTVLERAPPMLDASRGENSRNTKAWGEKHRRELIRRQGGAGGRNARNLSSIGQNRGVWKQNKRPRGGSEALRRRLEQQLREQRLASKGLPIEHLSSMGSRKMQPKKPFPLPMGPFQSPLRRRPTLSPRAEDDGVGGSMEDVGKEMTLEEELWTWLKSLQLSASTWNRISNPIKWRREFSNGYVVAEVLHQYYQGDTKLGGLPYFDALCQKERKKINNWLRLERFFKAKSFDLARVERLVAKRKLLRTRRATPLPRKSGIHRFNVQMVAAEKPSRPGPLLTHEDIIDGVIASAPGHAVSVLEAIYFHLSKCGKIQCGLKNLQPAKKIHHNNAALKNSPPVQIDTWDYTLQEQLVCRLAAALEKMRSVAKRQSHGNHKLDTRGFQKGAGGAGLSHEDFQLVVRTQIGVKLDNTKGIGGRMLRPVDGGGESSRTSQQAPLLFGSELSLIMFLFDKDGNGSISYSEVIRKLVRVEERLSLSDSEANTLVQRYMSSYEDCWERLEGMSQPQHEQQYASNQSADQQAVNFVDPLQPYQEQYQTSPYVMQNSYQNIHRSLPSPQPQPQPWPPPAPPLLQTLLSPVQKKWDPASVEVDPHFLKQDPFMLPKIQSSYNADDIDDDAAMWLPPDVSNSKAARSALFQEWPTY